MMSDTCAILDCPDPVDRRGWCSKHYYRWWSNGDPLVTRRTPSGEVLEYVLKHYLTPEAHSEPWPYAPDEFGYGQVRYLGAPSRAHRVSCTLAHGPRPPGMVVTHSCLQRPSCFWADHLAWGTQAKNIGADRRRDGTVVRGTTMHTARLNEDSVRAIREQYSTGGFTMQRLGELHGVSDSAVCNVVHRNTWGWVS